MVRIKKGLDLPIQGSPQLEIDTSKTVTRVAVTGADYIGMKPTMAVKEGDSVKIGQPLFSCKKNIGLTFTSPAAGKVVKINRGEKRVFQTMEIEVASSEEHQTFSSHKEKKADSYSMAEAKALLLESGMWTSLRQRPFDKVADVDGKPAAVFITAADTNPLTVPCNMVIQPRLEDFSAGVHLLAKLTEGKTYICQHADDSAWENPKGDRIEEHTFAGIHPAGNVGTHMHFIDPVNPNKMAWHIGYQDVIAIGHLVRTGKLDIERIVSLAGPHVKSPRILKTRRGACLCQLVEGELLDNSRVISGSVFHGRTSDDAYCFLGHYANQITAIKEDHSRPFMGWHSPGPDMFSVKNIYVSKLIPNKLFSFGSSKNGSLRAMVPTGNFEQVMPMDILPTQLLRALCSADTDSAQDLGCLELAEEDLALCTFVDSGKVDYGPILRDNLTTIEKEG